MISIISSSTHRRNERYFIPIGHQCFRRHVFTIDRKPGRRKKKLRCCSVRKEREEDLPCRLRPLDLELSLRSPQMVAKRRECSDRNVHRPSPSAVNSISSPVGTVSRSAGMI